MTFLALKVMFKVISELGPFGRAISEVIFKVIVQFALKVILKSFVGAAPGPTKVRHKYYHHMVCDGFSTVHQK